MPDFVIPPPPQPCVAVQGGAAAFPVRRIYCVGLNYTDHAREMGADQRDPPCFFQKPASALAPDGAAIAYPPQTEDLHHEVELVAAIGVGAFQVAPQDALDVVWGYGVGVDLTRRDRQNELARAGRPWEWAKAFDRSAPCGALRAAADIGHPSQGRIWLTVNGHSRQEADISQLIWPVPDIVSIISHSMRLEPGDLIFTGTPAGVGPLKPGDSVAAGVDGVGGVSLLVAEREWE